MTEKQRAAIQHIKDTDKLYLLAKEIGPAMGYDPQWVRICARNGELPFRHEKRSKKKIVFPKKAFLDYLKEVCGLESP